MILALDRDLTFQGGESDNDGIVGNTVSGETGLLEAGLGCFKFLVLFRWDPERQTPTLKIIYRPSERRLPRPEIAGGL